MSFATKNKRISRDAALLAVQWKLDFAQELQRFAEAAAGESDMVTVNDYQQALPEALQAVLENARIETTASNAAKEAA